MSTCFEHAPFTGQAISTGAPELPFAEQPSDMTGDKIQLFFRSESLKLSRRKFNKCAGVASLAMAAWKPATVFFAREPELQFPARPADRLALTSWPFRSYMESPTNSNRDPSKPGMDIVGFAKMAIERFDIHNINPLYGSPSVRVAVEFLLRVERKPYGKTTAADVKRNNEE